MYIVDAFADRPFTGNPAAVCVLPGPAPSDWMQQVAAEMNLSETAFAAPGQGPDCWSLRWFTPLVEVQLCGHATLAAAHVLWESGGAREDVLKFETASGLLTAARTADGVELDFPVLTASPANPPAGLLESLGAAADAPVFANGMDYLVALDSTSELLALTPDFGRLTEVDCRGVIVTSPSDEAEIDFCSRFFAPRVGVNEDPVTGSAHCCLAPYWAARLSRNPLVGKQLSRRGGLVRTTVQGDRVRLGGRAITVLRGELLAPPPRD